MRLADALRQAASLGVARLDAQLLLLHQLQRPGTDRGWLLAHDDELLPPEVGERFLAQCRRRLAGEPVAYLVGEKEFFGLCLHVDHRVLVPRPETETLVEWALELLEQRPRPRVLDLGTGSGAIALAIKHRRPDAEVEAVDRSEAALQVAAGNALRLGLQLCLRQADWLQEAAAGYDLIVSNPPYVAEGDAHLDALRHEPLEALVAGVDGLQDIVQIVATAPPRLAPGGWLLLEHGWDQAAAVRRLLADAGLAQVASRADLAGIARCTGGIRLELG